MKAVAGLAFASITGQAVDLRQLAQPTVKSLDNRIGAVVLWVPKESACAVSARESPSFSTTSSVGMTRSHRFNYSIAAMRIPPPEVLRKIGAPPPLMSPCNRLWEAISVLLNGIDELAGPPEVCASIEARAFAGRTNVIPPPEVSSDMPRLERTCAVMPPPEVLAVTFPSISSRRIGPPEVFTSRSPVQ